MDAVLRSISAALVAYLCGTIPWAVIVVRIFWRTDIREYGSGNTGATNVLRVFGPAPGISVLVLDAAKGAAGVWLAALLAPDAWGAAGTDWFLVLGAIAAIAGHSFSPWIRFQGGKGVATTAGALLIVAPRVWLVMLIVFLVVVALGRMVSLGSIVLAIIFPVVSYVAHPDRVALILFSLLVSVLVLWRHRSNMGRIARGEEAKITFVRRMWDEGKGSSGDEGAEKP
jgi:glycerol-3-phosphate acyltransferase PlsY